MARNMYGATSADFTLTSGGRVVPGSVLTLWSARTGGIQITDLLDVDSVACTTVTSAADGSVVYYGPNNDKDTHWAQASQGSRIAIRPVNITGETGATPALTVGTVTTGTAAATLTGTDEDPVLNLTIPPAANDSITSAMIAADSVTAAKIAADAVGASELADGAVDAAALADGSVTPAKLARPIGNLLTDSQAMSLAMGAFAGVVGVETSAGVYEATAPGTLAVWGDLAVGSGWGADFTLYADLTTVGAASGSVLQFIAAGGGVLATHYAATVAAGQRAISQITASAPNGTVTIRSYVAYQTSAVAGTTVQINAAGLWRGAGGSWVAPGLQIPNLGIRTDPANSAQVQVWNNVTATWITV